jgi:GTPase
MAFIDELKVYAEAGRGGDGVVRWRREKFVPKGGPAGGDGGRGGDFYIRAVRDIHILSQYTAKKEFYAERGEAGGKKSLHGKKGEDFFLELPIGSVVTRIETGEKYFLNEEGQEILLLKGGYGGYGNEHFKSSTNVAPEEFNEGQEGEKGDFHIELQIFADIGLLGLPNAGKSSLLNSITNAKAKVGNYEFTTLDPNLGDFHGYVIADIPGIIEGASEGKGLGVKFLRHVKRTKMLAHLVSVENADLWKSYLLIRKELEDYESKNKKEDEVSLLDKKEIIILSKVDLVDEKELKEKVKVFEKNGKEVLCLSLYDDASLKNVMDSLIRMLKEKND